MAEDFDLDDFDMIDMTAKKVLAALSEFSKGVMVKGELIHKKTGLTPKEINGAVRSLGKSLLVDIPDIPDALKNLPPYDFYAVEITDFGRQVLRQYA